MSDPVESIRPRSQLPEIYRWSNSERTVPRDSEEYPGDPNENRVEEGKGLYVDLYV